MIAIDTINRMPGYHTLRTQTDLAANTHWCFMHAQRFAADLQYRPCFSPLMLKDIREFQRNILEQLRRPVCDSASPAMAHLVLASDASVFNLGGDLDLFSRLIRNNDRKALLAYARQCVEGVYAFHTHLNENLHTIALVQGDALGGGFEAALSCQTIIAESGVSMGLPEVIFDLFPGMGAYSFLCKRVAPALAEKMILNGSMYSSDDLYRMGVVDILVPRGDGIGAVHDFIRKNQRIAHARQAMSRVRAICEPIRLEELMAVTEIWVDTAMQLGEKSLRTMERLVRAQQRRETASPAELALPSLAQHPLQEAV